MSTIGQINNLSLLDHQQQALSVCDNHSQKILQEIGSTVDQLLSSSTKFKEIFDRATQGVTNPYDIHFSENEIRINGQVTALTGVQDSTIQQQAKNLLTRINQLYDECHPSTPIAPPSFQPQQQMPYPMMMPGYPPMYPQMPYGYYPQCAPMAPCPMFTQPQQVPSHSACGSSSCCHRNSTDVSQVRSTVKLAKPPEISTRTYQTAECQTTDDDSAMESKSGNTSSTSSRSLSRQSSNVSLMRSNPAYQTIETQTDPINLTDEEDAMSNVFSRSVSEDTSIADDDNSINSQPVSRSTSSEPEKKLEGAINLFAELRNWAHSLKKSDNPNDKAKMRKALAELLIQNTPQIANALFFGIYLIGEKKRRALAGQTEEKPKQADYEFGKELFIHNDNVITDDDRELAIERLIMQQLADELANTQSQENHSKLLQAYQALPHDAKNKIEGLLWEIEGGNQDAAVNFGAQGMMDTTGDITNAHSQATAIRNYLDKQLAL